jgi:GT2 family glycosyltransferase
VKLEPVVSAVVLTWNSRNFISSCIDSLMASTYPLEIVVVDNDSQDGTEQCVRKQYPFITVIQTHANLGYAGGTNIGIREVIRKNNADYIFLLNPDAFVKPTCISELVRMMQDDGSVGMASPKIYTSTSDFLDFAGSNIDWRRGVAPHIGLGHLDRGQFNTAAYIDRICGCAALLDANALTKVGLLDESYFLYWEDVDLSVRFTTLNYKILYVPSAVCWHDTSSSTGGYHKPLYQYYMTRNNLVFMGKYGQNFVAPFACYFFAKLVRTCWRLYRSKEPRSLATIGAIFRGVYDYCLKRLGKCDVLPS